MEFPDVHDALYNHLMDEYKKNTAPIPCYANRASIIGEECERRLVYERTNWEDKCPMEFQGWMVCQEGNIQERKLLKILSDSGQILIHKQKFYHWQEYEISGHVDACIPDGDFSIPFEIKSMAPFIWDSICFNGSHIYTWESVSDRFAKKPWLRKYLAQLTIYMLMENVDRGVFGLVNRSTGAFSQVNVQLDYEYGEQLLQRATRLNKYVTDNTLPERIPFSADNCPKCPFYHLCLPDQVGRDPLSFIDDQEIEELLETRRELEEAGRDFNRVDKKVKAILKSKEWTKAFIGDWLVTKDITPKRVLINIKRPGSEGEEDNDSTGISTRDNLEN